MNEALNLIFNWAALLGSSFVLVSTVSLGASLREVHVDAAKVTGQIRSFQGVNCGPAPLVPGKLADVTTQYKDVRIDLVRTHDFFGPTDVDARWPDPDRIAKAVGASGDKAIFRDWKADPNDARSYNFEPSDQYIKAIVDSGAQVYYRLGRSWSADPAPPPDFEKFAQVCQHIAMHYNDGWANGFHHRIQYWEIWNEPDAKTAWDLSFIRPFWSGTPEEFYRLYEATARALKSYDASLKVGGCAQAAGGHRGAYRENFLEYCAQRRVPLDFFSWHHYHPAPANPMDLVMIGKEVRELLDKNGFTRAENHVSEWGLRRGSADRLKPDAMSNTTFVLAALMNLQDSSVDRALWYRGDATTDGCFTRDGGYRPKAYVYKAAGAMLDTPQRLATTGGDSQSLLVLGGRSADGTKVQVLIANYKNPGGYRLVIDHLPWGSAPFWVKEHRLNETDRFDQPVENAGRGGRLEITSLQPSPTGALIVLEP